MILRNAFLAIVLMALLTAAYSFGGETPKPAAQEIPQDLMAAVHEARYAIHQDGREPWAANYAQKFRARFGEEGTTITLRAEKKTGEGETLSLHLRSWGIEGSMRPAGPSRRVTSKSRVAYEFDRITEWWTNSAAGIEHGFEIPERPAGDRSRPLIVDVALEGGWTAHRDGNELRFEGLDGTRLHYGKLVVVDAKGESIGASLGTTGGAFRISVADADAVYP